MYDNRDMFLKAVLKMGVHITEKDESWEGKENECLSRASAAL
jgi:hypothetical protein